MIEMESNTWFILRGGSNTVTVGELRKFVVTLDEFCIPDDIKIEAASVEILLTNKNVQPIICGEHMGKVDFLIQTHECEETLGEK